ncbi:hypothetical protein IW261DRAFT_1419846 [Armillaria novae-zelandiae]|uniref:Uncharacterized protein n=1 Tax=Armillaria novae-zelandiae TaxID=153914 RepID=A0AA39P8Y3_9AGAR|nr:hypothetical protein IW261DRAFT_1419846 [Armillaria novae-zelandiae]
MRQSLDIITTLGGGRGESALSIGGKRRLLTKALSVTVLELAAPRQKVQIPEVKILAAGEVVGDIEGRDDGVDGVRADGDHSDIARDDGGCSNGVCVDEGCVDGECVEGARSERVHADGVRPDGHPDGVHLDGVCLDSVGTDGTADAATEGTTEGTIEGTVEGAMDDIADGAPDAIGVVNELGYVKAREWGAVTLATSSISHSSRTELESEEGGMVLSELCKLVEALEGVRVKLVGPGGLRYRTELKETQAWESKRKEGMPQETTTLPAMLQETILVETHET